VQLNMRFILLGIPLATMIAAEVQWRMIGKIFKALSLDPDLR